MGFCLLGSQSERGSVPEVPPCTVQFVRFACGKQAVAVAIAAGAHCLVVCFVWWRLVERRGCRAIQDCYLLSSIVIYYPSYLLIVQVIYYGTHKQSRSGKAGENSRRLWRQTCDGEVPE